jgi:glucose/arabinose dehydrogenase
MTIRITAACLVGLAGVAQAQQLTTTRLASGLTRPVFVCSPPGDTNRLFIVEQRGSGGVSTQAMIKILNLSNNTINATPFLTIGPVATGAEQGLLSLLFDTNYANNGRFFIFYTNSANSLIINRYLVSADPNVADATSGVNILTQTKTFNNHNGGWMGFGPDGYMYVGIGDGGSEYDPNGMGQSLTTINGKIIRIDVSAGGPGYAIPPTNPFFASAVNRQEIWAYGLRNPWRPSFDRQTGDLWIADVGQDTWEEVDFQPRTFDPPFPAVNYGWRCYEGNAVQNTTIGPSGILCSTVTNFTFPIYVYPHNPECSITGGYVYRGCAMPYLRGTYFFADYCSGKITSLQYNGVSAVNITDRTAELATPGFTINAITSFGEDARGELYICDQGGGEIYKIIPRCKANCDGSTTAPILNANDFQCFLNEYASGDCYANCDGSTTNPILNANDFQCFLNEYAAGCS